MQEWLMRLLDSPKLVDKLKPETKKKLSEVTAQQSKSTAMQMPHLIDTNKAYQGAIGSGAAIGEAAKSEKKQQPDEKEVKKLQTQGVKENPQLSTSKQQREFADALEKYKKRA